MHAKVRGQAPAGGLSRPRPCILSAESGGQYKIPAGIHWHGGCIEGFNDNCFMGVDYYIAKKIQLLGPLGRTLTLGRQNWWCAKKECKKLGLIWQSNYGRAFVHDPTGSLPAELGQYDTIVDLGTAEHVADQPSYWKNLHAILKSNGRLIVCVPANQHCGHGLYQFSPEFFANMGGFSSTIWLVEYGWNVKWKQYTSSSRFEARHAKPTYVYAVLVKNGPFSLPLQNATATHCRVFPFAEYLLDLPFVRNFQRILA